MDGNESAELLKASIVALIAERDALRSEVERLTAAHEGCDELIAELQQVAGTEENTADGLAVALQEADDTNAALRDDLTTLRAKGQALAEAAVDAMQSCDAPSRGGCACGRLSDALASWEAKP